MANPKSSATRILYFDACTFLHAILGDEPATARTIKTLLTHCKEGKVIIVTSSVTLAEVVRPKKCEPKNEISSADKLLIDVMFRGRNIKIVDCSRPIAERARQLQYSIVGIRPMDAIHLATAEDAKVTEFNTTDERSIIKRTKAAPAGLWRHQFKVRKPFLEQPELGLE